MATKYNTNDPSVEVKDANTSLTPPPILQREWKALHDLFPQSAFHIHSSKSKEFTVTVPFCVATVEGTFCFHLPSKYPSRVPEISIVSKEFSKSEINDVLKSLDLICISIMGQPMLLSCVQEGVNLLENLRGDGQKLKVKRKQKKKKRVNEISCETQEEEKNELNIEFYQPDASIDNFYQQDDTTNEIVVEHDRISMMIPDLANEPRQLRPNYFIAVRICDEVLIKNLVIVQKALVEQEDLLTKGVIPMTALHITLCNLGLDKADDLLCAMEAMRKMKLDLGNSLPSSPLVIHGASQFYDRAIYAKVRTDEEFLKFRSIVKKKLSESGVEFREDHEQYTPHVTLIKVRRPERRMFGNRPIRPQIYSPFLDSVHGEQVVRAIYLCAMDGNKREDGFYVTPYELQFEKDL